LAGLAYQTKHYQLAERLLSGRTHSGFGEWIEAKLALHRGHMDESAQHFAAAAKAFPELTAASPLTDVLQRRVFEAERGVLYLARGEYVEALEQLDRVYQHTTNGEKSRPDPMNFFERRNYGRDVAYVAERVLTSTELQHYVDTHPDGSSLLRSILARRLMREDHFEDAKHYFSDEDTKLVARYEQARAATHDGKTLAERAAGSLEMAKLEIASGMNLRGSELFPDYTVFNGNYYFEDEETPSDLSSKDERGRVDASHVIPKRRFHYRQVGTDRILELVRTQPLSKKTISAILCQGAATLRSHSELPDGILVRSLYNEYKKRGKHEPWDRNFGANCPTVRFD
jgi:hypothetical protein